jgi:hypothetical protein
MGDITFDNSRTLAPKGWRYPLFQRGIGDDSASNPLLLFPMRFFLGVGRTRAK